MKKKLLLPIYLSLSSFAVAQVGINQPNPNLSADLELGSTNKSLLLNRVPNPGAINNPVNGMLIYDVSEECVKAYQGNAWSQCFWKDTPFALLCASAVFNPSPAIQGQPYSGTLTIPYTGGDGSAYATQTITSNAGGFTAFLPAGVFASGNGTLQYSIVGNPTSVTPVIFNISVKGSTCSTITLPVNSSTPVLPSNIILQDGIYFVGSVFDNDYAPFTDPTGPATIDRPVAADGTPDKLADYQGVIPTSGLQVFIPATATGSGTLPAWSSVTTVPASLTEDGNSRIIRLSWVSQSYNSSTPAIKATLTAVDGTLNARKLDINAGIGNDYLGVLMARFQFPSNSAGTLKKYDVRILPGIPDKKFGAPDNAGAINHNFLYLPVQAEDGNTWLNNNLGADYTNTNSPNFSIAQQATNAKDFRAYGSLFQWGRKPDGHELVNWTSFNTGVPVYNQSTPTAIDNPTDTKFIATGGGWRVNPDPALWASSSAVNTPCPKGFKVPTQQQMERYLNGGFISGGINSAAASKLALPAAGNRNAGQATISNILAGSVGNYWTSSAGSASPSAYIIEIGEFGGPASASSSGTAQGSSVRCIKE